MIEIPAGAKLYVRKRPQVLSALALWLSSRGGGDGKA